MAKEEELQVCGVNVRVVIGGPHVQLPCDRRWWIGMNWPPGFKECFSQAEAVKEFYE